MNAPDPHGTPTESRTLRVHRWLVQNLTGTLADRVIAVIACTPFIFVVRAQLNSGHFNLSTATSIIQMLFQIVPMMFRRRPERVTSNIRYWLLAFVATYWPFLSLALFRPGPPLVDPRITDALSLLSLILAVWSRTSLGKNIGFVPAQRHLVARGAYAHMRHPIYTSIFVTYIAYVLNAYSPWILLQSILGCFWFIIKSIAEERFLREDPAYREYMKAVRWRWVPGLL